MFYLKTRSLEHAIKLLDIHLSKKVTDLNPSHKASIYPHIDALPIELLACLFMTCKYNEIYPPALNALIYHWR